jgi:phosphomevalonate kinase
LVTRVVWTGHAARTSDLVGQVKRFEARDPAAYHALSHELGGAASAFADAFQAGRLAALLPLVERYHDAMRALGDAAGAPIVEARLTEVARLAKLAGGRAKPSGAGGGDVAIAFFSSARDAARFDLLLADAKFETLALRLGADGPRRA